VFFCMQLLREYFIPLNKQLKVRFFSFNLGQNASDAELEKNRISVDYINEKVAYWTQRRVPRLMTSPDVLNLSTEIFAFNAMSLKFLWLNEFEPVPKEVSLGK